MEPRFDNSAHIERYEKRYFDYTVSAEDRGATDLNWVRRLLAMVTRNGNNDFMQYSTTEDIVKAARMFPDKFKMPVRDPKIGRPASKENI